VSAARLNGYARRLPTRMPRGASAKAPRADDTREAGCGVGLEIIAKLATVLEVEPAELLRLP
jgi:hypothetical protein